MKVRITNYEFTGEAKKHLLKKLDLEWVEDMEVWDHETKQFVQPKEFIFAQEFIEDSQIRQARLTHPATSEATEEEIKDWAEMSKNLEWMDDPVAYAKARKKLQFVEYNWEDGHFCDIPCPDPIDTARAQYAEDPWAFFTE